MRNFILSFALILITGFVFAQQVPLTSQYFMNPFVINPALTGNHENVNAFLTSRSQWTGVNGAPQTNYLTIDGPINEKSIGLGLMLYSDRTDIVGNIGASANYSYKLKVNDDNNVFFGISLGVINKTINFSKVVVANAGDPFLLSGSHSKSAFSADFGVAYEWKKLQVGISIPQILGNSINYNKTDGQDSYYTLNRQYQGTIKYVFDVVEDKEITAYPLLMTRYAKGSTMQYDIGAVGDWKKYGWLGIIYHSNSAVAISGGVRYKNLSVGYAYDIGITSVKSYTGATSEFLLSYTFGNNKDDVAMEDPKDALVDAAMTKLQEKVDTNQAEIQRLKDQLAKLKTTAPESPAIVPVVEPVSPPKEREMLVNMSNDFVDDNGMAMAIGYYVVIGTFSSKDNANKFKDANLIKGYNGTQIMQNHKTKVYNVYYNRLDKQEDAESEQKKFRAEYPDVWIQKLE